VKRNDRLFRRRSWLFAGEILCLLVLLLPASVIGSEIWRWRTASPQSQSMSSRKLEAMRKVLEQRGTKALLIVRNDRIVYEWYARGYSRSTKHYTASLAKACLGSTTPLQGFLIFAWTVFPGLGPGLSYIAPFGLTEFPSPSPEGASYHSPGQRPGTRDNPIIKALKERNNAMPRRRGRTPLASDSERS